MQVYPVLFKYLKTVSSLTSKVSLRDLDLFLLCFVTVLSLLFFVIIIIVVSFAVAFSVFTLTGLLDLDDDATGLALEVSIVFVYVGIILAIETWHLFEFEIGAKCPVKCFAWELVIISELKS